MGHFIARTVKVSITLTVLSALVFFKQFTPTAYSFSIEELTQGMNIIPTQGMNIDYPKRALPNKNQDNYDLDHWLSILPSEEDKNANGYIVYPKAGIIVPLVWPNEDDSKKIKVDDVFDHFKYLRNGALHYLGNSPKKGNGNMVLAMHSSFQESDIGKYNTVGQAAPVTKVGDSILLYLADDNGSYTLYTYEVRRSEEIPDNQLSILNQTKSEKMLTLYTCYPIGTTDNRRVNQAVLTETMTAEQRQEKVKKEENVTQSVSFVTQSYNKQDSAKSEQVEKTTLSEHNSAPEKSTLDKNDIKQRIFMNNIDRDISTGNEIPQITTSGIATNRVDNASRSLTPTVIDRILYRAVIQSASETIINTLGDDQEKLQKINESIANRVTKLSNNEAMQLLNRKKIILLIMLQEVVERLLEESEGENTLGV